LLGENPDRRGEGKVVRSEVPSKEFLKWAKLPKENRRCSATTIEQRGYFSLLPFHPLSESRQRRFLFSSIDLEDSAV